jgi:hypothetical protein
MRRGNTNEFIQKLPLKIMMVLSDYHKGEVRVKAAGNGGLWDAG